MSAPLTAAEMQARTDVAAWWDASQRAALEIHPDYRKLLTAGDATASSCNALLFQLAAHRERA